MEVRRKVLEDAAPMLQAKPDELDIKDGMVFKKPDPENGMPVAMILIMAGAMGRGAIIGEGRHGETPPQFDPGCFPGLAFPAMPTPTYHVHAVKVRVDPVTGNVRVLRYLVAQGIGYSLYEGLRIENSRYVERSLEAYRVPLAGDIPEVEAVLLEHPHESGPYGAKGVAEAPLVLGPWVIGNAIADAIGVHIPKVPITPEDVLAALEKSGGAK